ncbi:MAG: glycosyltransferase family 1 protein [Bdellovibrionales bacterium]|nr:glycosyltransferase family 1 protein [Bdellovibrionales bacterium]
MRLLVLNQDWFVDEFRQAGHEVVTCGLDKNLDVPLEVPLIHLDSIIKEGMDGIPPDCILVLDNSAPIVIEGLAETKIPSAFYSVDTHHHAELHGNLCQVFDHVFVAQKDYVRELTKESPVPIEWLPLFASRPIEPSLDKEYGAVFVGTLRKELNPERVEFFEALKEEVPLLCKTGKFWEIFPYSEIVINQTVKGDLNFRVFEAMMSGALLLTERSRNGLFELFDDGKHLVTYEKNNVAEAAEQIRYYLEHLEEARTIGIQGRDEVLRAHTPQARADTILSVLEKLERTKAPYRFFGWMNNFTVLSAKLKKLDTDLSRRALLSALKSASIAYDLHEELPQHLSYSLVYGCCRYDMEMQSDAGYRLLLKCVEKYPQFALIKLALVRFLLNHGRVDEARQMAKHLEPLPAEEVFQHAELVVSELLVEGSTVPNLL